MTPPEYTYITQCENGFYKAWQEEYCEYFNDEEERILRLSRDNNVPFEIGDYIWQLKKGNETAAIYNRKGELVKTVDFTSYGTVYYHDGDYTSKKNTCEVRLRDKNDGRVSQLFHGDARLLLSEDMIPEDIQNVVKENNDIPSAYLYIEDPFDDGSIIKLQYRRNKEACVAFAYSVTDKTGTRLYDLGGGPMKTKDGK